MRLNVLPVLSGVSPASDCLHRDDWCNQDKPDPLYLSQLFHFAPDASLPSHAMILKLISWLSVTFLSTLCWLSSSKFNRSWFCELHEPQIGKLFSWSDPSAQFLLSSHDGHQSSNAAQWEGRRNAILYCHKSQESLFIILVIIDGMSIKWQWIARPLSGSCWQ